MIRRLWTVLATIWIMANLAAASIGQHLSWLNWTTMIIVAVVIIVWIICGDKALGGKS